MFVACWLFVVSCGLFGVVGCLLIVFHWLLFVVPYSLVFDGVWRFDSFFVCCVLFVGCFLLFGDCCVVCNVCCYLFYVCCFWCFVCFRLFSVSGCGVTLLWLALAFVCCCLLRGGWCLLRFAPCLFVDV